MIASIPIVWRPMPMAGRPHVPHLPAGPSLPPGPRARAPPPSLERAGASPFALGAAEEVGAGGTASLSGNVLAPGASPPRVIGTHRLHPPLGCHILVETVDEDEIAEVVMVLNGPHALSELRAGNIDADDIEELDYELCDGLPASPIQSLVTRQGFTHAAGIELSGPPVHLPGQGNP